METHKKDARNVEHEGDESVEEEHSEANAGEIVPTKVRNLAGQGDDDVHDGANRGVVVEANEGVHLKPLPGKHYLDHDDADGLEADAAKLVEEPYEREVDFADRGNGNAGDDDEDIDEGGERGVGNPPGPRGQEDGDRSGRLEHLNESDREVEVDEVGADQGPRVEEANGADCADVQTRGDG